MITDLIAHVWPFDPVEFWRGFIAGAMVVLATVLIIDTEDRKNG